MRTASKALAVVGVVLLCAALTTGFVQAASITLCGAGGGGWGGWGGDGGHGGHGGGHGGGWGGGGAPPDPPGGGPGLPD